MKQPDHLIFVCQNMRDTADPRGSCMARGSRELLEHLKGRRAKEGLKTRLRVMGATCLGACESGIVALVVDGDGATFYGRMDRASADALLDERVLGKGGAALCRHRLPPENLLDVSALAEDEDGRGAEADAAEEDQGDQGEAT
ncbi:MAG: (2Fe-2S) ferredoxin domain-containing protein [Myxococcales bacterium]|nr:(2Fe-2S) ferredoxin domain-containing protein [Myxococcales bacterium]